MNNTQEQKRNFFSENKGRGLFYAVIAIATFIVMAVGATFAYFTATTQSLNSAVQTGSTTLQLKYISYGKAWSKSKLIPADTNVVEYSVEFQNDTTNTSPLGEDDTYLANGNNTMCIDDYGNEICSIYVFQITNSAPSPQTVSLSIVSQVNGFSSLHAMAYELTLPQDLSEYESTANGNRTNDPIFRENNLDDREGAIDVTDANKTLLTKEQYFPIYINRKGVVKTLLQYTDTTDPDTQTIIKKYAVDRKVVPLLTIADEEKEAKDRTAKIADDIDIKGEETKTFAVVLYIKNENYDQTATDAEKTFSGQIVVSSGDGTSGVSGTIGAVSAENFNPENLQSNTTATPPTTEEDEPTGEDQTEVTP